LLMPPLRRGRRLTQRRTKGAKSVLRGEQTPQTPQVLGEVSGTEADHPDCRANYDGRDVDSGNSVKVSRQLIHWTLGVRYLWTNGSLNGDAPRKQSGDSASASVAPSPSACPRSGLLRFGRGQFKPNWSAAELNPQMASPGPGRHRLSGRGRIFAKMLGQRSNREVTNKQLRREL
jgi:hypothetical protein